MTTAQSLELKFANANSCMRKAYAYAIEMQEGISIHFKSKITLLSDSLYSKNDLDALLKGQVTIRVAHFTDEEKNIRIREFDGIVTSYLSKGRISKGRVNGKDVSCYAYELSIEPKLVLLALKKYTRSFTNKTPLEVINFILDENNIPNVTSDSSLFDCTFEDKNIIFEQSNESDLSLLNKICSAYGINYVVARQSVADSDSKVIISRGWTVDKKTSVKNSKILLAAPSDKTIAAFDGTTEKNYLCLDNIQATLNTLACTVGKTDSGNYLISAEYEGAVESGSIFDNEVKDGASYSDFSNLESLVSKNIDINSKKSQQSLIEQSFNSLTKNLKEKLYAKASDFIYVPGANIEVDNLFGTSDKKTFQIIRNSFRFKVLHKFMLKTSRINLLTFN